MRIALCNEVLAEMPFARQCEFAARLGYDALEVAPFTLSDHPDAITAAEARGFRKTAESFGLSITGLHWLLVKPDGLSLTEPDADVRRRTRAVMSRLTGLCAELGGRVLVHGSPRQRQIPPGEAPAAALERLKEALAEAGDTAAKQGVTYCIEPLSRQETPLINTVAEAADIVRQVGSRGLRTMIDCSAAGLTEIQPVPQLIRQWVPTGLIGHIQVNDRNRRGPGQGADRFRPVFQALRDSAYGGDIGVEPFIYEPDGPACAARCIGYLRGLLEDEGGPPPSRP